MADHSILQLNPVSFLQTFVTQSLRAAGQLGCAKCDKDLGYIEDIGLTAGPCFEAVCRRQLGLDGQIDLELRIPAKVTSHSGERDRFAH